MRTECPQCRHRIAADDRAPGSMVRCPRCRGLVTLSRRAAAPAPEDEPALLHGDLIGGVRVLRPIGAGSMSQVFAAATDEDERVAVKVLPEPLARRHENYALRFARECRLASRFQHPNLVTVLEVGFDRVRDLHFMIMEYVEGDPVSREVEAGGLAEARALATVRDVARALLVIGREGVVHRDVKPSNMLRSRSEGVKLADLGLAKSLADSDDITRSFATLGSIHYMSPEQVTDPRAVDPRADLFSLGSSLFAMLTGRPPFTDRNLYRLSEHIVTTPHPDPGTLRPGLAASTLELVDRLMAKDPADRFADAGELLAFLESTGRG